MAWKKLQGDVFRAPDYPHILATAMGVGFQISLIMGLGSAFFLLGFLHIYIRTVLFYQGFFAMAFASWPAGFLTARLTKFFGASEWVLSAIAISFFYPGMLFSIFSLVDFIEWSEKSSQTVPFTSVMLYMMLWLVIAVPLAFHGSYRGFLLDRIKTPNKVNPLRRENAALPFYLQLKVAMPMFGLLIFASIFAEFQYVVASVWRSQIYVMLWYLYFNFSALILIVSLISIIVTYLSLSAGHHAWWWRSFFVSGDRKSVV